VDSWRQGSLIDHLRIKSIKTTVSPMKTSILPFNTFKIRYRCP
jgi:hypothetical protein